MTEVLYKRPPITEAVIGINLVNKLDDKSLNSYGQKLIKFYPEKQVISNVSLAVGITDNNYNKPDTKFQVVGNTYRLSSQDMSQIVILSESSLSFSQLAPYQGWDNFFNRFTRDWAIGKNINGFQEVARIGVRYINRIDIPIENDQIEYENYLNIYPFLPKSLGNINAYAIQILLPIEGIDCKLNINSAVVPSPIPNNISFVVDFDIYKDENPPQSDEDIFNLINQIRIEKNRIFEECITDNARKLFNRE